MEKLLPDNTGPKPAVKMPHVHGGTKMDGIDPGMLALLKDNGNGDEKSWWLILLILLLGKDGGLGGSSGSDRCCQPSTLEQLNDAQNAIQNGQVALSNRIGDQTSNIIRDIGTASQQSTDNFARLNETIGTASNFNLLGQKDITAAIAKCCCDNLLSQKETQSRIDSQSCETRNTVNVNGLQTQNAILSQGAAITSEIEKCCCATQNAIAMQTNALTTAICNEGQLTRQLLTDNRMQDLQTQLQVCRDENSNLRQTEILSRQIRECCCSPCHPHPWPQAGQAPQRG